MNEAQELLEDVMQREDAKEVLRSCLDNMMEATKAQPLTEDDMFVFLKAAIP